MSARIRLPFVVLLAILCAAAVFVGDALQDGEDALIARRYDDAVTQLERALTEEPVERQDRVLLLLARAQFLAGRSDAAIATYERLTRDHPESRWIDKAAVLRAETLAAAKRQREAALVYRDQLERLARPERKEVVAETYLGLADRALGGEHPDPQRAVTFYDLALDLGLGVERALGVRLLAAEATLRAGSAADAIRRLEPLVTELSVERGKLRAMLLLGRARLASGDANGARTTFRDLIAAGPAALEAGDAALEIANSYGVPNPGPAQLDRAVAALRTFATNYPAHPKAAVAESLVARCFMSIGRSGDALAAFRAFLAASGDQPLDEVPAARAAVGFVLAGQGALDEAIAAWQEYLKAHPAHAEWEPVQRAIVDAELARATRAETLEHWAEARELLEAFGRDHPLDVRNPNVLFRIGESFASESRWNDARAAFERCVRKYPGHDEASHAQYRIGEIYESKTFDYQRALDAYKAVTFGAWQARAAQRWANLERKSLALETPRSYRVGEAAEFRVRSRNIADLRVRVYRLDLETWFRATHLPGSVERLDIEVIEPDRTFQSPVPEYVPYRETERGVPIGFGEPGAYVVKVDDQELEATTMVLVTDLGLIVKTSRRELFAFAQDLKTEQVRGGVRVVVSDGTRVLSEGLTDDTGVFRWRDAALRDVAELRVFAVDATGSGAGTLDLSSLGYGAGLTAKAVLFTDRNAYRPGDVLHVKGIVRDVRDGIYALPTADASARLSIVTMTGREVQSTPIVYDEFGSFAVDFPFPENAELGLWRLALTRGADGSDVTTANVIVDKFELPRLLMSVETDRKVVFRGEPLAGRVVLRHAYGDPAAGTHVRITMTQPDGTTAEVVGATTASGVLEFSFDTTGFAEESFASIAASAPEEGVATTVVAPVVTTEFQPRLTVARDVQIAGQPFDVTVDIVDRSGAPLAKDGEVRLVRRVQGPAGVTEVDVAAVPFRTRGTDGRAIVSITAADGGTHVLRARATDRFGQMLTADRVLEVSGDDDATKLRVLCARQSLRVGEQLDVTIVNRSAEHLALRTIQADGILDYAAVRIPHGESHWSLPLVGAHAPNFALAFAMIDGTELRTAELEVLVARELALEVHPKAAVTEPGAEAEFEIVARDEAGRPVVADVALALASRALSEQFPDRTEALTQAFWGTRRETEFRTVSTCGFAYAGPSRPVSRALIDEERRRAEALEHLERIEAESASRESAFDSNQWNSAVGLGAGAGGRFAGRARGRNELARDRDAGRADDKDDVVEELDLGGVAFDADQSLLLSAWIDRGEWPRQVTAGLFADASPNLLPDVARRAFTPDGAWLSGVRTDDGGKATVRIPMPLSSGEWRLVARASTRATDVGETKLMVRTAQDLVASVTAPLVVVAGDRVVARARVHNRTADAADVELGIQVGADARRTARALSAGTEFEVPVPLVAGVAGPLPIDVVAQGPAALRGEAATTIEVVPFGIERRTGRAGVLTEDARFTLQFSDTSDARDVGLSIDLRPAGTRTMIAAATGPELLPSNCRRSVQTNGAIASRGLAALHVLEHLDRVGDAAQADRSALQRVVDGAIAQLLLAQRDDGGIAFVGGAPGELRTTAQTLRLFAAANRRGTATVRAAAERAADWIVAQLRGARDEDRADPEAALAAFGRNRFEALNALHRRRASLDFESLGWLALAWRAAGRAELASEVDTVVAPKLGGRIPTDTRTILAVALAVRSRLLADATDAMAQQALDWLEARRVGAGWPSPEVTAAVLGTLGVAGGADRSRGAEGTVDVTVNGAPVAQIPLGDPSRARIEVPGNVLRAREGNLVELHLNGRGRVAYSAVQRAFVDGVTDVEQNRNLVAIERTYLPALLRIQGREVSPGFSICTGRTEAFRNKLSQLPLGESGRVETTFFVFPTTEQSGFSPVVVEEPIPAGCTVPRASIRGQFEAVEAFPDRLVFYYRPEITADQVSYELRGRFEGSYRVLPTVVRSADRPDLLAYGRPGALDVLARGAESKDVHRWTPDERYALARAAFDARDLATAGTHLDELVAHFTLRDDVFREVAKMMLLVSIGRTDARGTVRWFEELKDRAPDFVVDFDAIRAVGRAYVELGEFESALLVYRATAEASFLKEANVATTLASLGEIKASVRFLRRLLDVYPDLNTMRQSLYGIGQRLGMIAADMPAGARVDPRVGSRDEVRSEAVATLREFLVQFPEDPLAEEVSFAWATTLVEGEQLKRALQVAEGALARYQGSSFEDEFLYTSGYVRFVLGSPDEALATVRRVATEDFVRPAGGRGPSENRKHAIYLEGQIQHALGKSALALAAYDRVRDEFSDAGEAAAFFRRRELTLPEVTTVAPKDETVLELTTRNLTEVTVKVYRVDLMRLYLLSKSLDNVRDIQLHGIAPLCSLVVPIEGGADFDVHRVRQSLPLTEDGAYLVVARSAELLASGLILRTDLRIDAEESFDVGRLRVNVSRDGHWVGHANVKVVGSGDGRIQSGDTDLRGIFVADGVVGKATVIARIDSSFAFYRGSGIHQPARVPQPQLQAAPQQDGAPPTAGKKYGAWDNNLELNTGNRRRQVQWLEQQVFEKKQTGVEVFRAK